MKCRMRRRPKTDLASQSAALVVEKLNLSSQLAPLRRRGGTVLTRRRHAQLHLRYDTVWSIRRFVLHVLTRDHTVLPATHTFIHKWNEPYLPLYSPAAEHHRTLAGTHFPSR